MAYFKIGTTDLSKYVSGLKVSNSAVYKSLQNAAGDTVIDYITDKRVIEVTFIPLSDDKANDILELLDFNNNISFLNPDTLDMSDNISVILPKKAIDYYTILSDNVMYKSFTLSFTEL